ncbi:ComEA family DNA-binding protein [Paenibacillus sp. FSL M8-0334]|uniref:ComEA family DNA-binding protein n=1 Tax=Paenibacillus sp. FSL M8-0334 TaxID=2921623 RepID=UPI0030FD085F
MRRISHGFMMAAGIVGCGLILFAGTPSKGMEGWEPLNDRLEQTLLELEQPAPVVEASGDAGLPASMAAADTNAKAPQNNSGEAALAQQQGAASQEQEMPGPDEAGGQAPPAGAIPSTVPPAEAPSQAEGSAASPPVAAAPSVQPADPASSSSGIININTASAAQLMELPGIGEKKAQAIIEYRNRSGPFRNATDLMNVKGIGPKMMEKMMPYVGL